LHLSNENPVSESAFKFNLHRYIAASLARTAAESGNAVGQFILGSCMMLGRGCTPDKITALVSMSKASEQGQADAMFALGMCYRNGDVVEKDWTQAGGRSSHTLLL
jgi:TPR repeat protein